MNTIDQEHTRFLRALRGLPPETPRTAPEKTGTTAAILHEEFLRGLTGRHPQHDDHARFIHVLEGGKP